MINKCAMLDTLLDEIVKKYQAGTSLRALARAYPFYSVWRLRRFLQQSGSLRPNAQTCTMPPPVPQAEAPPAPRLRPCLGPDCEALVTSTGPHHRLCDRCRARVAAENTHGLNPPQSLRGAPAW